MVNPSPDIPGWDGVSEAVRVQALPLRNALINIGWTVGVIRWLNLNSIRFMVQKPRGKVIPVVCDENGLVRKLQELPRLIPDQPGG